MKVYLVFSTSCHDWADNDYFEEVFSTRKKAEDYINSIDPSDKEGYDYWIHEREVC